MRAREELHETAGGEEGDHDPHHGGGTVSPRQAMVTEVDHRVDADLDNRRLHRV